MNRWITGSLLAALAAGALGAWYAIGIERTQVQLERFTVPIDAPGLPPEGLTVLHLSDFHFSAGGTVQARKIARLHRLLAAEQYDVVALTGDLVHDTAGFPVALALVARLQPRLGAFVCPGNHDYAEYSVWGVFGRTWRESGTAAGGRLAALAASVGKLADFARKVLRNELVRMPIAFNDVPDMLRALQTCGVMPLVNGAQPLRVASTEIWFAGIDDALEGQPDLAAALATVPEGAPLVLLAHNPDIWLEPDVARADLVLAGHTHGGQVRLPLMGAAHTQGTHLSRNRPAGWFHRGRTRMFVSRGLGESIPLRFGARPQAALIRLVSERGLAASH